jgi:CRISPR-associated protein (TIGR03986 family)
MSLPEHQNPRPNRAASAPYNFVPLPEVVIKAVPDSSDLPDHDRYYANRHTGYFEVGLTTKSPLYIRCPVALTDFLRQERNEDQGVPFRSQVKNTPDFFYTRDSTRPVIPGSSLRGMLRNLAEIVSYGKIQSVTDKTLFFRTVDDTAVGRYYRRRMTGKVEAGFLQQNSGGCIIKASQFARVQRNKLGGDAYEGQAPNKLPRWKGQPHQWAPVWVQLSKKGPYVEQMKYAATEGWHEGRLIITGDIPGKKKEFVFPLPSESAEEIAVPANMLECFHDDDQLTQWQERAFPKNQPTVNSRERDGVLRKDLNGLGDPVFFLRENGQVTFLGRAQMFRLPYRRTPRDLVPVELRTGADIDYGDSLFGYTKPKKKHPDDPTGVNGQQGERARAYAGRVFVTDASLETGQNDVWLSPEPIVPQILATPKPTAFQHYLTQQEPDDRNRLDHYDSPPLHETIIRGHKRYWHQGLGDSIGLNEIRDRIQEDRQRLQEILNTEQRTGKPDTQHTQLKPLKPGVTFTFRVYFENHSDAELGALCWTLNPLGDPAKTYCHSLGMGKPLGMGAVKLDATLHLTNRNVRYSCLFDGDEWQTGVTDAGEKLSDRAVLERLTQRFELHVLDALKPNKPCAHLSDLKRIGMLLKMMEWPGLSQSDVATLALPEFRQRKVLPDPSASLFGGLSGDAVPTVANEPSLIPTSFNDVSHSPQEKKPPPGGKRGGTPKTAVPRSGELVRCILLEEKTKKGGWKAKLKAAAGVGAVLPGNEPLEIASGQEVELVVQSNDPKNMSFRWPKKNK